MAILEPLGGLAWCIADPLEFMPLWPWLAVVYSLLAFVMATLEPLGSSCGCLGASLGYLGRL